MSIKLGAERIGNRASKLFEIFGIGIDTELFNYSNVGLADVNNKILILIGEKIMNRIINSSIIMINYSYKQNSILK